MEAGFVALLILTAIVCTVVGIHIGKKKRVRQDVKGVLNVDCSDPESIPYLFLQLEVPIEDVIELDKATFVVRVLK